MTKKISLIGVPVMHEFERYAEGIIKGVNELYCPGETLATLDLLAEKARKLGLEVLSKEEVSLANDEVTAKELIAIGKEIQEKNRRADRIICIGPDHLGALVLYSANETIARLDCHGDYHDQRDGHKAGGSYGSYMNDVMRNFKGIDVINYGVMLMQTFGRTGASQEDEYLAAGHFDIDIDVFDKKFRMNMEYYKSCFNPKEVLEMLHKARPRKIGVWEYRPKEDFEGNAKEFLESVLAVPF